MFTSTEGMHGSDAVDFRIELHGVAHIRRGTIEGFPSSDEYHKLYVMNPKLGRSALINVSQVIRHFPKTP